MNATLIRNILTLATLGFVLIMGFHSRALAGEESKECIECRQMCEEEVANCYAGCYASWPPGPSLDNCLDDCDLTYDSCQFHCTVHECDEWP